MFKDYEFTMDSFGADCPANWEEIADALNDLFEERSEGVDDPHELDEINGDIWEKFCAGELANIPKPVWEEEDKTMKPICEINLNDQEGRQTISWNPEDGMLYSSACEEPVDGYTYDTIEEAAEACDAMWGKGDFVHNGILYGWNLEWIEEE